MYKYSTHNPSYADDDARKIEGKQLEISLDDTASSLQLIILRESI